MDGAGMLLVGLLLENTVVVVGVARDWNLLDWLSITNTAINSMHRHSFFLDLLDFNFSLNLTRVTIFRQLHLQPSIVGLDEPSALFANQ